MIAHFILFVEDQRVSAQFYARVLSMKPRLDVPGMTEFALGEGAVLGLMPYAGVSKLLGDAIAPPQMAHGIPRAELYLRFADAESAFARAIHDGAKVLSPWQKRTWGMAAGYFADPDGHVVAFSE